jgi:mono/diheme cytochrome c family protein
MGRRTKITLAVGLAAGVAAGVTLLRTLRHGFSAQDEPTRIEHVLARTIRHYATPSDLRARKNPVPLTPDVLAEARAHFADHCAVCHGNDGKGQTAMGPNFYPKVPDMTLAETQSQADGELFATIENGIRLTGMPAWGNGTAESAYGSWTLVHFIRHLPKIGPEEIAEMDKLNPKSREEFEQEEQERKFLAGDQVKASSAAGHDHR